MEWGVVATGLIYAAYFVLRYRGLWMENDTAVFSQVTARTLAAGTIFFPGQYPHGYGYPAWSAMLAVATGLRPAVLQTAVLPYVGILLLMVPSLLLFSLLLRSRRVAAWSVLLMLLAPDLTFAVLRGNHEKLNIALLLISFYVLFQGFEAVRARRMGRLAVWVVLFYLCAFLNASVNDYFASSFVLAEGVTVAVIWFLQRRGRHRAATARTPVRQLWLAVASSWLLVWWVMLFVFLPAGHDFRLVAGAGRKLLDLFESLHGSSNPFTKVAQEWAGRGAQFAVAAFRYVLALGSFGTWCVLVWRAWRRGRGRWARLERLFLFGAYAGFALSVAAAVPLDFSGLGAGSNLEVRNFTYFALLAAPLFAVGLHTLRARARWRRLRARKSPRPVRRAVFFPGAVVVRIGFALLCGAFLVVSLWKVTLDPLVSNQWMFYTPAEGEALVAFSSHAVDSALWAGPDDRLPDVMGAMVPIAAHGDQVVGYAIAKRPQIRDLLISPAIIANCLVEGFPLPYLGGKDRIYDDGGARIYRDAPETIFED